MIKISVERAIEILDPEKKPKWMPSIAAVYEANRMGAEALRKDVAAQVVMSGDIFDGCECPRCGTEVDPENLETHCRNCGQKLDWTEVQPKEEEEGTLIIRVHGHHAKIQGNGVTEEDVVTAIISLLTEARIMFLIEPETIAGYANEYWESLIESLKEREDDADGGSDHHNQGE